MLGYKTLGVDEDSVVLSLVSRDINERTDKLNKKYNFVIRCTSYKQ